jgi:hypothetical protein
MRKLLGKYGLILLLCLLLLASTIRLAGELRLQGNGGLLSSSCVIVAMLLGEMQKRNVLRASRPLVGMQWGCVAAALALMFLVPANS